MKMSIFATLAKTRLNTKYKRLKIGSGQAYDRSILQPKSGHESHRGLMPRRTE